MPSERKYMPPNSKFVRSRVAARAASGRGKGNMAGRTTGR